MERVVTTGTKPRYPSRRKIHIHQQAHQPATGIS
jgi:hypothetical protein